MQGASLVHATVKQELYGQLKPALYVYFPTTAICSLIIHMQSGQQVESSSVGNEGMLGVSLCLGLDFSPFQAVAQVPGELVRVPAGFMREAMRRSAALMSLQHRWTVYVLRYTQQTVACNALHNVEQRLCRWLLTMRDRSGSDRFALTHELLSEMLGVRRQTVSLLAGLLQDQGLINYSRGILNILNRSGLERCACECYAVARALYRRIVLGNHSGVRRAAEASLV